MWQTPFHEHQHVSFKPPQHFFHVQMVFCNIKWDSVGMLGECTPSGWCENVNRLDSVVSMVGGVRIFSQWIGIFSQKNEGDENHFAKKGRGWDFFRKKEVGVRIISQKNEGRENFSAKKRGAWEIFRKNVRINSQRTVVEQMVSTVLWALFIHNRLCGLLLECQLTAWQPHNLQRER